MNKYEKRGKYVKEELGKMCDMIKDNLSLSTVIIITVDRYAEDDVIYESSEVKWAADGPHFEQLGALVEVKNQFLTKDFFVTKEQ